jgi:predicted nucleic acid-binding protein
MFTLVTWYRLLRLLGFAYHESMAVILFFVHPAVPEPVNLQEHKGQAKPYQVRQFLQLVEEYHSSRYHLPRRQVMAWISSIEADAKVEIVHVDQKLHSDAVQLLAARLNKEWSLVDASSFVIMGCLEITEALTTDHHFAQAGFRPMPEVPKGR